MILSSSKHQSSGYHDSYAEGTPRGVDQATRAQDGATIGDTFVLTAGSPMGSSQKYQSSSAKTVRHPVKRNASLFLQIQ
jgi:hypothetical protein